MMQKRFKQLMLLAAFVPTFAMAQALQSQTPAPADSGTAAAAPVDPAKQAAIKDLAGRDRRAKARRRNR
jgi:hypothetical protein